MIVRRSGMLLAVIAVLMLVQMPAFGQSTKYKRQIEQYSTKLDQQAKKDEGNVTADDREMARQWLEDARVLLARGEEEEAGRLLQRVAVSLDMLQAILAAEQTRAKADELEENFYSFKEKKIPRLQQEIEELQNKKQKLKGELNQIK